MRIISCSLQNIVEIGIRADLLVFYLFVCVNDNQPGCYISMVHGSAKQQCQQLTLIGVMYIVLGDLGAINYFTLYQDSS